MRGANILSELALAVVFNAIVLMVSVSGKLVLVVSEVVVLVEETDFVVDLISEVDGVSGAVNVAVKCLIFNEVIVSAFGSTAFC